MIDTIKIIWMVMSALICLGLPIVWYLLIKKERTLIGFWIAGGLSFYLTQMVIRLPILQLLLPKLSWYEGLTSNIILYGLFLGLTAALFETAGRSLIMNLLLKKRLSYKSGIIHGIGHGGIEAILFVGINYVIYVVYSLMLNNGQSTPMTWIVPMEQQELLKNILMQTESVMFLMAGLERAMTMVFHVAMSLLIAVGIMKRQQLKYTAIVVLLHTILDFGAVLLSNYISNVYLIEAYVLIFAIASGLIIVLGKKAVKLNPDHDEAEEAVAEGF